MNNVILNDLKDIIGAQLPWETLEQKRILITGANGFLPAYMVETILYLNRVRFRKPAQVVALVRNKEHSRQRFLPYLKDKNFKMVISDISDFVEVEDKIDIIIHAASQASPKFFGLDPVGTLLPNIIGTRNLLEIARKNTVENFLYFSSGEVYGSRADKTVGLSEESYGFVDPLNVRSCYAESKRMAETMCIAWAHQYDIPVKIVRPFHTYGPGMKLDDGRVFADFVANIVRNENIILKSDGSHIRPFCYLADATSGFFNVLLKGENQNAYNIANPGQQISIKQLAETLVLLFPEKQLRVKYSEEDKKGYLRSPISVSIPDITKITRLGWAPKIDIREGFEKTIRSYNGT